jgi:hypothetical protein
MEIGNLAQWASALLSAVIAILAIWGDLIRYRVAGPRLAVDVLNPDGERTVWKGPAIEPKPTRFYHLRVSNGRRWAPARNVRVVLTGLARTRADQSFASVPLSGPLQLQWQFAIASPQFPTIGPYHTCDLGHVEGDSGFSLAVYVMPHNFQGAIRRNERMRVEIRALADNGESKPLLLEIAWDGQWSDDTVEMRRHLTVKRVTSIDV